MRPGDPAGRHGERSGRGRGLPGRAGTASFARRTTYSLRTYSSVIVFISFLAPGGTEYISNVW